MHIPGTISSEANKLAMNAAIIEINDEYCRDFVVNVAVVRFLFLISFINITKVIEVEMSNTTWLMIQSRGVKVNKLSRIVAKW